MKKTISILTALVLSVSMSGGAFAAYDSLENFLSQKSYNDDFPDLCSSDWYYPSVKACFEYGLMNGVGGRFDPKGHLTVAQALVMACRIHQRYRFDQSTLTNCSDGGPWYQTYVDYALEHDIIEDDWGDYGRNVTREEMAHIFRNALLDAALPCINRITNIPDVELNSSYGPDIYTLYRAGVLTGKDARGSFLPDQLIIRAEAAAILARMALPEQRVEYQLGDADREEVAFREEAPVLICERGVLAQAAGLKLDASGGAVLELYLENNTAKPIEIICTRLAVNGYMIDCRFAAELKGSEKRYAELIIPAEALTLTGISGIQEVTTTFNVMDTIDHDSWNSADVTLETAYTGNAGGLKGEGGTLVDELGIRVTFEKLVEGRNGMGPGLLLYVENSTGMPVALELNSFKLNRFDVGAEGHHEIPGGMKKVFVLQSLSEYMPEEISSVADIREAELSFTIFETDSYENLVETGPITLDFTPGQH